MKMRMRHRIIIRNSIQEKQKLADQTAVPWPPRANTPVNEFNSEACAFPTLFPTGTGYFLAPREHVVTVDNYLKHLMRYDDGRFERHLLSCDDSSHLLDVVDKLVNTVNLSIPADGNSMQNDVPKLKSQPHACDRSYGEITDLDMDLVHLIATRGRK